MLCACYRIKPLEKKLNFFYNGSYQKKRRLTLLANLHQANNKKRQLQAQKNSRKRWRQQRISTVKASYQTGVKRRQRKEGGDEEDEGEGEK